MWKILSTYFYKLRTTLCPYFWNVRCLYKPIACRSGRPHWYVRERERIYASFGSLLVASLKKILSLITSSFHPFQESQKSPQLSVLCACTASLSCLHSWLLWLGLSGQQLLPALCGDWKGSQEPAWKDYKPTSNMLFTARQPLANECCASRPLCSPLLEKPHFLPSQASCTLSGNRLLTQNKLGELCVGDQLPNKKERIKRRQGRDLPSGCGFRNMQASWICLVMGLGLPSPHFAASILHWFNQQPKDDGTSFFLAWWGSHILSICNWEAFFNFFFKISSPSLFPSGFIVEQLQRIIVS